MGEQIQPVRGMNDVLPEDIGAWHYFEHGTSELRVGALAVQELA